MWLVVCIAGPCPFKRSGEHLFVTFYGVAGNG